MVSIMAATAARGCMRRPGPEGHPVSRGQVERLMRRHGIRALARRRFRPTTTDSRHLLPIPPNLLQQNFTVAIPNRVRR